MVEAIAFKMSSDSKTSLSSDSMETSDSSDSSGQDWGVFDGQMSPYGDEPLAEVCDDRNSDSEDEKTDLICRFGQVKHEFTVSVDRCSSV